MKRKKILITGASRGIGLAIAKELSDQYSLILHASQESSFAGSGTIPHSECLFADFSDPGQVNTFCKTLRKAHGDDLYAVINNAGTTRDNSLIFQTEKDIDTLLQVNLKAPVMICKTAMKIFNLKKEGVIINMSSVIGEKGNAFQAVYAAAKAGLIALSRSLAQEAAALQQEHRIRVLSITPGFIETDMTNQLSDQHRQKSLNMTSSHRAGRPEEVASLVSFLLSEQAAYINGTNVQINGGLSG